MNGHDAFTPEELSRIRAAGATLERYTRTTDLGPRASLAGDILAAIATEPTPAPLAAMAASVRRRRPAGVLAGLRDAWRVAWSGGRPARIRASSAIAVLLVLAIAGGAGGAAAAAAWNAWLAPAPSPVLPSPLPFVTPAPASPTVAPEPTPTLVPVPSPTPTPDATPSPTPEPTARPTPRPTHRPAATPTPTHHPEASHHADGE